MMPAATIRVATFNISCSRPTPGGLLAGYFFLCDQAKGPPFGILPAQLDELLTPNFTCIENAAAADSIPVFAGRERWQVWRRR